MSFKIIIEVPDSKVVATLKLLNGHKCYIENMNQGDVQMSPLKKAVRVMPTTRLMLGKNFAAARNESLNGEIVALLQKHEGKHGAGSLTRGELTEQLEEYSDAPAAAIGAAIRQDIIRGIADG